MIVVVNHSILSAFYSLVRDWTSLSIIFDQGFWLQYFCSYISYETMEKSIDDKYCTVCKQPNSGNFCNGCGSKLVAYPCPLPKLYSDLSNNDGSFQQSSKKSGKPHTNYN